jgi:tetratricopeptide (TPR) repeat protein
MAFNKAKVLEDITKLVQKGDYSRAIAEYERVLKIEPKDYKLRQRLGELYLRLGKKKEAVDQLMLVAEGYIRDGFNLQAIAIYRQILRIEPRKYEVYDKIADLYNKQGLQGDAVNHLRMLADAYEKERKIGEAMQTWEKIISIAPDNIIYRAKLIEFYLKQGLYSRSTEKLKQSIDYLKSKGRYEDVELLINKFPGLIEEDKTLNIHLARSLYNAGKYKEALSKVDLLLNSDPNNDEYYCLKGHCYTALGDLNAGKEAFKNALKINPESLDAKKGILRVLIKEKNTIDFLLALEELYKQLMAKKQYDELKTILDSFYVYLPNEKKIIKMYVDLFRTKGEINNLIEKLKKLGTLYVEDNDINEAAKCYKEILAIDPYEPSAVSFFKTYKPQEQKVIEEEFFEEELEEISELQLELQEVESHLKYGLLNKAKQKLEELSTKYQDSLEVKELWLKYFEATKDKEGLLIVLKDLINIYKSQENFDKVNIYQSKYNELAIEDKVIEIFKDEVVEDIELIEEAEENIPVEEEHIEKPQQETNVEEMFLEADFYIKNGLIDDARKVYENILKIQPDNIKAKEAIEKLTVPEEKATEGIVEAKEGIAEEQKEGFFDISKEIIKEIEEEEKLQGIFKSEAEKITFEELLKEFKSKISQEIDENDVETHYNLGIAYKEMGLLDEAIQEFVLTSRFLNKAYDSYTMIAACLGEKREYRKAIEFYKKALLMPDVPKDKIAGTYLEIGYIFENLGELDKALFSFKKAYDMDNNLNVAKIKIDEIISKNPLSTKILENPDVEL